MRAYITVLVLSLSLGFSSDNSQQLGAGYDGKRKAADNKASKPVNCDNPKGYSVEDAIELGSPSVNIVNADGRILHSIKLLTGAERNGFAHDGVNKTKEGFEFGIEYGSRNFYHKRFIFICRQHKFYLDKIDVDSFDRLNPKRWSRKVIRAQPKLPIEKFFIADFMLEGVVK